jgi:hypothetical protein
LYFLMQLNFLLIHFYSFAIKAIPKYFFWGWGQVQYVHHITMSS